MVRLGALAAGEQAMVLVGGAPERASGWWLLRGLILWGTLVRGRSMFERLSVSAGGLGARKIWLLVRSWC